MEALRRKAGPEEPERTVFCKNLIRSQDEACYFTYFELVNELLGEPRGELTARCLPCYPATDYFK